MLSTGDLSSVVGEWLGHIDRAAPTAAAATLYTGRSFTYTKRAAVLLNADIDVLSAGLGYVRGGTIIPSYNLAAGRGYGSVADRISQFKSEEWWKAVNRGRFAAERLPEINGRPVVMIALTRDYARMVRPMLEQFAAHADRIRIFGAGLAPYLPLPLADCLMPYDEGMELKGTKGDFAGRAMLTHARLLAAWAGRYDLSSEREAVRTMTRNPPHKASPRKAVSDEAIVRKVSPWLREEPTIAFTEILRRLRDHNGIACSQERARRIVKGLIA